VNWKNSHKKAQKLQKPENDLKGSLSAGVKDFYSGLFCAFCASSWQLAGLEHQKISKYRLIRLPARSIVRALLL
jgi:hypothetical protein